MTYPLLLESVAELLKKRAQDYFNVALTEVDNQYDDGITLEPLDDSAIYFSDLLQTVSPPALYILSGSAAFQYSDDPNYLNLEDEFLLVITSEDMGADRMQRKAWRYQRVLMETFNLVDLQDTNNRLKIRVIPQRLGTSQPIKTKLTEFEQKYRMDALLEVKVMHYEKNIS